MAAVRPPTANRATLREPAAIDQAVNVLIEEVQDLRIRNPMPAFASILAPRSRQDSRCGLELEHINASLFCSRDSAAPSSSARVIEGYPYLSLAVGPGSAKTSGVAASVPAVRHAEDAQRGICDTCKQPT